VERLFTHLYEIRKNHALYLTDKSLRLLHTYIDGYVSGQDETNHDGESMRDFQQFVEKRHGFLEPGSQGWWKIIDFYSFSDSQAFDTFFELLDKFLQSRENESDVTHGR